MRQPTTGTRPPALPFSVHGEGYITLGDLARCWTFVNVACNRCERRGRLNVTRLVAVYGAIMPVPELRRVIAADCPRMMDEKLHDPCGVHFPGLAGRGGRKRGA